MAILDLIGPGCPIEPAVIQAAGKSWTRRYPYAAWMPIPEATRQPQITLTTFVLHSMAGPKLTSIEALRVYMAREDVTGECTFIADMDGRVAQLVEADQRADCNYKANQFAASVETQDVGYLADPGIENTPWTDPQAAQLAGIAAFLHLRFGVPLRRCDTWNGGGVDGHRRFPEWSVYVGKTCPGDTRWEQIDDVITAAQWIVDWRPAPPPPPPVPEPTPIPVPATPQEDVMIVAKTTDGGHYAAFGLRTGALHIGTQITVDGAFATGVALDASAGLPLKKVVAGSWPATVAAVTKAQAFAILGEPVAS